MWDDKPIAEYVGVALALHDLHLDTARQAEVTEQFCLLAAMARTFMDHASPDEEPAPVYRL